MHCNGKLFVVIINNTNASMLHFSLCSFGELTCFSKENPRHVRACAKQRKLVEYHQLSNLSVSLTEYIQSYIYDIFCFHKSDPSWVHSWPEFNHWTFTQVHTEVVDFQFNCFSIPLNFNIFSWLLFKLFYDHSFPFCLVHVCEDQLIRLFILKCCLFIFVCLSTAWTQPPYFVGTAEKITSQTTECQTGKPIALCMI